MQQSISFTAIPGAQPRLAQCQRRRAASHNLHRGRRDDLSAAERISNLQRTSPAASQGVQWTLASGFAAATTSTVTNNSGIASESAILGPLSAGAHAIATACAWGNVCAQFDGLGVAASAEAITVVSGAGQSVIAGAPLAPVVITVVDGSGHPVAAAAVSVYQTASAFDATCPPTGRCPAAATLATQATVEVSGIDGTITVTPLVVPGTATQTEMAFSVGTQGFATVIATSQP